MEETINDQTKTETKPINIKIEFINIALGIDPSTVHRDNISAVFLVGIKDGMILAAKNERGWDIPGGHIEGKDTDLYNALVREVDEESGAVLSSAEPFALMRFDGAEKSMLFYRSNAFILGEFVPKSDALEREMMPISEFIEKYHWKKDVMQSIIDYAADLIQGKK